MFISNLNLKNVGPFNSVNISFPVGKIENNRMPITIITGQNGTGKTIIIDAIRGLLNSIFPIERKISRDEFSIKADFIHDNSIINIHTNEISIHGGGFQINTNPITEHFSVNAQKQDPPDWIITYWTSKVSNDKFNIGSLVTPEPKGFLRNAISGVQSNIEITELICYFDYLKSSDDPKEAELGLLVFNTIKDILKKSLLNGSLEYVARRTLEPVINQNGNRVNLQQLSSGSLYIIQRLISLLGKFYSVFILNNISIDRFFDTTGILLIDEAENHLHPLWQKRFIGMVQDFFPNLQIILTTHSPFIVASVENAKIYVCEARDGYSEIIDATDAYSNKPIDEILLTPVFNTQVYNEEISALLNKRELLISENSIKEARIVEDELISINPERFSFFRLEEQFQNIFKQ
jgi:predicted ATP-binding protein involved in virulence